MKLQVMSLISALALSGQAMAKVEITPYVSIKSNKTTVPSKDDPNLEEQRIDEKQEYGIRGSIKFNSWFGFQLGIGQSTSTSTEKANRIVDTYGKIDLASELNIDTSATDADVRVKETQKLESASLVLDPSFSIFILRIKAGITAMQRDFVKEVKDAADVSITDGPNYLPQSSVGLGIKLTRKIYFLAEYEFLHYAYPTKFEPFERKMTVSMSVDI